MKDLFKSIPSVDELLKFLQKKNEFTDLPRTIQKELINEFLDLCRERIKNREITSPEQLEIENLQPAMSEYIKKRSRPNFRYLINATGVVVHTNLGRSILADSAINAAIEACTGYSNLEFSLETGKRGSRYSLVEDLLCELSGAEAGLVVNNNAAAVLLMLDTLASGWEVIVSRGQLVEIGGSFRIPEVMEKSWARLREVGATNRTHIYDYQRAINSETAAILKAHTSNFAIIGFHKEVKLQEMVELGERYNLPVLEDLGSGNFFRFPEHTGLREPTVQDAIKSGVSVVTFSGDKLLGGPQAGIILGKKEYVERIKKNPLNRALRIDKMTLASLEATLRLYKDWNLARVNIPTLNMISTSPESLRKKANRLSLRLKKELGSYFKVYTKKGTSRVGGGASPELELPTRLVALHTKSASPERLRELLLETDPPLVGRVEEDALCLDPRTLKSKEFSLVVEVFKQVAGSLNFGFESSKL